MFFHLQRGYIPEAQAKLYFAEIVLTFEFLHKNKIIYRDLKVFWFLFSLRTS